MTDGAIEGGPTLPSRPRAQTQIRVSVSLIAGNPERRTLTGTERFGPTRTFSCQLSDPKKPYSISLSSQGYARS